LDTTDAKTTKSAVVQKRGSKARANTTLLTLTDDCLLIIKE